MRYVNIKVGHHKHFWGLYVIICKSLSIHLSNFVTCLIMTHSSHNKTLPGLGTENFKAGDSAHNLQNQLELLVRKAIDSCVPAKIIGDHLPSLASLPAQGRLFIIGAGKASAAMGHAVESYWKDEIETRKIPTSGLIITRYGYAQGCECDYITIKEAAHPVPDDNSINATKALINFLNDAKLTNDDIVICLISGGGSALLCAPPPVMDLQEKQRINKALLKSGAPISDMNCVRKHLSIIKGGRLAQLCSPAQLYTLMISDVPGDDPAIIASGPTIADPTSSTDALDILNKYQIDISDSIRQYLNDPANETPKSLPTNQSSTIIASAQNALENAASYAQEMGYGTYILSDRLEGESRDCALFHGAMVQQIIAHDHPFQKPCAILSGGETTVTVKGKGKGGRNTEFLLSLFIALQDEYAKGHQIYAIACDTDGIDGVEDNAGAFISPDIYQEFIAINNKTLLNPKHFLDNNDAYSFFEKLDALVKTGPTNTNVNDFRAILILRDK